MLTIPPSRRNGACCRVTRPAGLVSMEDGVVGSFIQRAIARDPAATAVLDMGGRGVERQGSRVSESAVRGFWQAYRALIVL
jgi:hypothetical protein